MLDYAILTASTVVALLSFAAMSGMLGANVPIGPEMSAVSLAISGAVSVLSAAAIDG